MLLQVGIARDHTLFALVEGRVQITQEPRLPLPPREGMKERIRKPWKKFANVIPFEHPKKFVLTNVIQPPS